MIARTLKTVVILSENPQNYGNPAAVYTLPPDSMEQTTLLTALSCQFSQFTN